MLPLYVTPVKLTVPVVFRNAPDPNWAISTQVNTALRVNAPSWITNVPLPVTDAVCIVPSPGMIVVVIVPIVNVPVISPSKHEAVTLVT